MPLRKMITSRSRKSLVLVTLVSLLSTIFLSCAPARLKIETEAWSIDPADQTIYRKRSDKTEEYISCSDQSAKKFICITKDDMQKVIDELYKTNACPTLMQ